MTGIAPREMSLNQKVKDKNTENFLTCENNGSDQALVEKFPVSLASLLLSHQEEYADGFRQGTDITDSVKPHFHS